MEALLKMLQAQRDSDMKRAQLGVEAMMAWSRRPLQRASESHRKVWDLEVVSGFHPPMLSFEWILASILARDAGQVFASFLPSSLDPEACLDVLQPECLVKATLTVLLLATRATAARRALAHGFALAAQLRCR